MRGDIDQVFIDRGRIRSYAKFDYSEGEYTMDIMGIKVSLKMEYRDPLAYQDQKEYFDNVLIDKFINNPEYLKRFIGFTAHFKSLHTIQILGDRCFIFGYFK